MSGAPKLDLIRLRAYIVERVKESERLTNATVADAVRRSHLYSARVGQSILDEIDQVAAAEQAEG